MSSKDEKNKVKNKTSEAKRPSLLMGSWLGLWLGLCESAIIGGLHALYCTIV